MRKLLGFDSWVVVGDDGSGFAGSVVCVVDEVSVGVACVGAISPVAVRVTPLESTVGDGVSLISLSHHSDVVIGAMAHDVTEDHEAKVTVAFVERHTDREVSVGGGEDVSLFKEVAEVGAARADAHGMEDEIAAVALFLLGLALEDVDMLGIGCVHQAAPA